MEKNAHNQREHMLEEKILMNYCKIKLCLTFEDHIRTLELIKNWNESYASKFVLRVL